MSNEGGEQNEQCGGGGQDPDVISFCTFYQTSTFKQRKNGGDAM